MRIGIVLALCVLVTAGAAQADEKPAPPPTLEQAVDGVLAAVKAGDRPALVGLAKRDHPDPWRVADALCYRGSFDAAAAFAAAAPRHSIEDLPAYVRLLRKRPRDQATRDVKKAMDEAYKARNAKAFGEAAAKLGRPLDTVERLFVAFSYGSYLLGRHDQPQRSAEGRRIMQEVLAGARALGWWTAQAAALRELGTAALRGDNAPAAVSLWQQEVALLEACGFRRRLADALLNLTVAQEAARALAGAIESARRAEALHEALGDRRGLGPVLQLLGDLRVQLGQNDVAAEYLRRALVIYEESADRWGLAEVHHLLGHALDAAATRKQSLAEYGKAHALYEALGNAVMAAAVKSNMAFCLSQLGRKQEARELLKDAVAAAVRLGDVDAQASAALELGHLYMSMGQYEEALDWYGRVLKVTESVSLASRKSDAQYHMGRIHMRRKEYGRAIPILKESLLALMAPTHSLAEEEGASVRAFWAERFDVGMRAALRGKDVAAAVWFAEHGRAGVLLQALRRRDLINEETVPADVARRLAAAQAQFRAAQAQQTKARRSRDLRRMRAASKAKQAAAARVEEAAADVQRSARRAAAIALPQPDGLAALQGRLEAGEALVLYALTIAEGVAVVVTREVARAVALPASSAIGAAVEALLVDGEPAVNPDAVSALRAAIVEPLGLPAAVRRVLVSPMERLSYVPFSLLFPEREVVCVPSGTTHGILREDAHLRGEGVLAVGDPDYEAVVDKEARARHRGTARGGLVPLPATRKEVEAVGDVRLLGRAATKPAVIRGIGGRARWRAVHFACHGLIDPERPMLSSLALTADTESGGFLTCRDVLALKIPADLVVLSACETGRGKVYKAEGIVGLTRAFMYAGAPRVICSLWKVDDDATRALMVKFYELWNPQDASKGLPAALALKQAQAHVRSHAKWKHPYYWAAWVLWGLPD